MRILLVSQIPIIFEYDRQPSEEFPYFQARVAVIGRLKRQAIAQAGHLRTINNHTYEKRFEKLIREMGLK